MLAKCMITFRQFLASVSVVSLRAISTPVGLNFFPVLSIEKNNQYSKYYKNLNSQILNLLVLIHKMSSILYNLND